MTLVVLFALILLLGLEEIPLWALVFPLTEALMWSAAAVYQLEAWS